MDAALPNDIAALIGFACEAALWGAYVILFGVSIVLLYYRRKGSSTSLPITIASVVLFLSCTAHFALEFNHFYTTLWAKGVKGFANETKPLLGADVLISLCDLFGDFILVYRCWVLWGKNFWVVLLPSLTAIAGFSCIAEVAHFIARLSSTSPVPPDAVVPLTTAGYALPLCTNVMATGLIVYKIWRTAYYTVPGASDTTLEGTVRVAHSAMSIMVESGMLYLATQLVFVVLVSLKHPAQAIVAVMAVQIYGIAPTLIVIRVGLGLSVDSTHAPATAPLAWATRSEAVTTGAYTTTTEGTYGTRITETTKAGDGSALELKADEEVAQIGEAR